jgi:hypothetical protein
MLMPVKVELEYLQYSPGVGMSGTQFCRFEVIIPFRSVPSPGDWIILEAEGFDGKMSLQVRHIEHRAYNFNSMVPLVVCETNKVGRETDMVDAYEFFRSSNHDISNIEGDTRPPKYYRLYRTVERVWGSEKTNPSLLAKVIKAILMAEGYDEDKAVESTTSFLNFMLRPENKPIELLKILQAWDIDLPAFESSEEDIDNAIRAEFANSNPGIQPPQKLESILCPSPLSQE